MIVSRISTAPCQSVLHPLLIICCTKLDCDGLRPGSYALLSLRRILIKLYRQGLCGIILSIAGEVHTIIINYTPGIIIMPNDFRFSDKSVSETVRTIIATLLSREIVSNGKSIRETFFGNINNNAPINVIRRYLCSGLFGDNLIIITSRATPARIGSRNNACTGITSTGRVLGIILNLFVIRLLSCNGIICNLIAERCSLGLTDILNNPAP